MSEQGMICGLKRFAVHDGDGIRTTVFFKGCPLRCVWCHNPESISYDVESAYFSHLCRHCEVCMGENCPFGARVRYGEKIGVDELCRRLLSDRPFYESSGGGVTLSGGECLSQPAFAIALAKALFDEGISVDIDTCGCVPWASFEKILPYVDTFLYDVKAIDAEVHKRCTGRENALILENLRKLSEAGARIEIRIPLVVGYNDGQIDAIGRYLSELSGIVRIKVLAYHEFARSRYAALGKVDTMPHTETTKEDVAGAVRRLCEYGLNAVADTEA